MPKGDDQEIVKITRKEWNELTTMIKDIHDKLCGNEKMGEEGLIDEHDRMYKWFLEQKWWNKKSASIVSTIMSVLAFVGTIVALILNIKKL